MLLAVAAGATAAYSRTSAAPVVVDVSNDETAQNETPIAVDPTDPDRIVVGANDWNANEGCAVAASDDGGATWYPSSTYPNGFLPGITRTNDGPDSEIPATGIYEVGGDPSVAFSPDGDTVYYACLGYNLSPPFQGAVLLNRSTDGGKTWLTSGLSQPSTFKGNGRTRGSLGQAADHPYLYVDPNHGYLYVTWAQFSGSSRSAVWVAVSQDEGATWKLTKIMSRRAIANEDQRVVTDASGDDAYLVFDSTAPGGKGGVAFYVSKSTDHGATWSTPVRFATLTNPVCLFPPYCFNISGEGQFRAGGSYPAVAYDDENDRLVVVTADIRGTYAQVYAYRLDPSNLGAGVTPVAITNDADNPGDHFTAEISATADGSRLDVSFYDRSYSSNELVDVTYAWSDDGGSTWTQQRVTSDSDRFDPSEWGVPGGAQPRPFIGDYNGIASTPTEALLAWTGVAEPDPYNLEIEFAAVTPA
jgi:hypothetical protein